MEVVLSPGRFSDEASGVPYQNEEIREWSHVDRLTGMLERARVETGRWQASIQGAARSYGKVIDSRERNSADGSVVQRARRQVEVFQSQEPGRSVQVVRASQWSSSKVTDLTINGPQSLNSITQKEEKSTDRFAGLCRLSPPLPSSLRHDEAISERLSSLLGSFTYPVSSTVPLRRIDSRYASRTPIPLSTSKRCCSHENVSLRDEHRAKLVSATKLLPESNNQRNKLFPEKNDFSTSGKADEIADVRIRAINVECGDWQRSATAVQEITDITREKNSFDDTRPATTTTTCTKAAIHLLPSSKANTTVVNLMNSGNARSWLSKTSQVAPESRHDDSSATMSGPAGRVKRVGFCKTEIHFAADSGKVNIVETDGKPPPTNKFRRRKRNGTCNKSEHPASVANANYDETLGNVVPKSDDGTEEKKKENDPNLHRSHTTTVNLGNDFAIANERAEKGFPDGQQRPDNSEALEASSRRILLRLESQIYDRLETYTSGHPQSDATATENIQSGSLKSAGLVLRITRQPNATSISNILIDNKANNSAIGNFLPAMKIAKDERSTKIYDKDNGNDDRDFHWEADNEAKSIMLGTSSLHNRNFDEFSKAEDTSEVIEALDKEVNRFVLVPATIPTGNSSKPEKAEDCNVLCTDAENNQVLLNVVTTHKPMIARVESHHLRQKTIIASNLGPDVAKKERRFNSKSARSPIPNKEHTYVNIFNCSKRAPIYENYNISDNDKKDINKVSALATNEAKIVKGTFFRSDPKNQHFAATSKSKHLEHTKLDKINTIVEDKIPTNFQVEDSSNNSRNIRSKKKSKISVKNKSIRPEVSSAISAPSGTSRVRTASNNNLKTSIPKKSFINNQDASVSSGEQVSRTAGGSLNGNQTNVGKSTRNVAALVKVIKKNDGTTKNKPMEVVYQTAEYNMKNERLLKAHKGKESKGPRYLNELICGAKTKRASDTKNKIPRTTTNYPVDKGASQTIRHWK